MKYVGMPLPAICLVMMTGAGPAPHTTNASGFAATTLVISGVKSVEVWS